MPAKIDPIATSESKTGLYGNTTTSADSSSNFKEQLKSEEEKLKTKSLLFGPGGLLENLFSSLSYHYDKSLTLGKIEREFNQQKEKPPLPQSEPQKINNRVQTSKEKPVPLGASENIYKIDPKVFEETLMRSLGAANLSALFLPPAERPVFITKSQLQTIIDEIVEQIALAKKNQKTELMLSLKPEQLGEILLKVSSKSGMLAIQILADEEAKKLLENNLEVLQSALQNAQLNIGNISVSVGNSHPFPKAPNLFSDISGFSQTLVENNSQNVLNLAGTRRLDLTHHLIDWEA